MALQNLKETLEAIKRDLSNAEFDDPPQKLIAALAQHRELESKVFSSGSDASGPLRVEGPAAIKPILTDLAWKNKGPGWLPHYRPKLNWPLAPTPKDIVLGHEFGNAIRSTPKWVKRTLISSALLGAFLGGVLGVAKGLDALKNASRYAHSFHLNEGQAEPGKTFSELWFRNGEVITPGFKIVEMEDRFGLSGEETPPTNGGKRIDPADPASQKPVWHLRRVPEHWKFLPDLPKRFELSFVNEAHFDGAERLPILDEKSAHFWLDSGMPQKVQSNGRLSLPKPEQYDLSAIRLYDANGKLLKQGKDFEVERSLEGHLALAVKPELLGADKKVLLNLGFQPGESTSLSRDFYNRHFRVLDHAKVAALVEQMDKAGLTQIAKNLRLRNKLGSISAYDVERAVKEKSYYSFFPEGEPHVDKTNPFWYVSRALDSNGRVCGDCDVVNEVLAVFFENYFRDSPEVRIERGVLFVRDAELELLVRPLHGQLYLGKKRSPEKEVFDSTPHNKDPRELPEGTLEKQLEKQKENEGLKAHRTPNPDKTAENPPSTKTKPSGEEKTPEGSQQSEKTAESAPRAGLPSHNEEENKEELPPKQRKSFGVGPAYHRFRFRGDFPEGTRDDRWVGVRWLQSDPRTEEMLQELRALKYDLDRYLQATKVTLPVNESSPDLALTEILGALENFVKGRIPFRELKETALRWAPAGERETLQTSDWTTLMSAVFQEQSRLLEIAAALAKEKKLARRHEYYSDPLLQSILLKAHSLAASVTPVTQRLVKSGVPIANLPHELNCQNAFYKILPP